MAHHIVVAVEGNFHHTVVAEEEVHHNAAAVEEDRHNAVAEEEDRHNAAVEEGHHSDGNDLEADLHNFAVVADDAAAPLVLGEFPHEQASVV